MRVRNALRLIPLTMALSACIGPVNTVQPGLTVSDEMPTRLAQPDLPPLPPGRSRARPRGDPALGYGKGHTFQHEDHMVVDDLDIIDLKKLFLGLASIQHLV